MAHTFVRDVMKTSLIKLDQSTSIQEAASKMDKNEIGCIIVTQNGNPEGIVTERDFVKKIAAKELPFSSPLSKVMSFPLITINPEETVWEAAQLMKTKNIHKLPVRQNNDIIGIITTTDLIQVCSVGSDSEMRRICDQIITRMGKNFE